MAIRIDINPSVSDDTLNALFVDSWPSHECTEFQRLLDRASVYACAYEGESLVGFAKVVSDGGAHAFLLDPTVSLNHRRKGIGTKLVGACIEESRKQGIEWLHVDFEPELKGFYARCGFRSTEAGLVNLARIESEQDSGGNA